MTDLHPIFVHFPIALLTVYAAFELVRYKKIIENIHWKHIKAVLAVTGEAFALLAAQTGHHERGSKLVETHHLFAYTTIWLFAIISVAYIFEWLKPNKYSSFVLRPYVIIPLALIGLVLITVTGGLGGAIVYGTHFDPFMAPIFKLLGVY